MEITWDTLPLDVSGQAPLSQVVCSEQHGTQVKRNSNALTAVEMGVVEKADAVVAKAATRRSLVFMVMTVLAIDWVKLLQCAWLWNTQRER